MREIGRSILVVLVMIATQPSEAREPATVVCSDRKQALRYMIGDQVKRKVMRQMRRCWQVPTVSGRPAVVESSKGGEKTLEIVEGRLTPLEPMRGGASSFAQRRGR